MNEPRAPAVEAFLQAFHDAQPGVTAQAFGAQPVRFGGCDWPSSYDVLAAALPEDNAYTRVLDLACGDAPLLDRLAARGAGRRRLAGVDLSAGELARARARLGPGVPLLRARAQALPFADGAFDAVLSHLALMLMAELDTVVAEGRRVLRPGGLLAAVVGAPTLPVPAAITVFRAAMADRERLPTWAGVRFGDRRWHAPDGVRELLAPQFEAIDVGEIHLAQRLAPEATWAHLLGMYDLHLLAEGERLRVRDAFLAGVAPHTGADGRLDLPRTLWRVTARAR